MNDFMYVLPVESSITPQLLIVMDLAEYLSNW